MTKHRLSRSGELEEKIRNVLEKYIGLNNVKTVLELGGRDCRDAVLYAEWMPNATIYSFEPNPLQRELCEKSASQCDRVHFIPCAAHDHNGTIKFYPSSHPKNKGVSAIYPFDKKAQYVVKHRFKQHKPVTVSCVRVDDWARENGVVSVDFLEIDVQGAELVALQGMRQLLTTIKVVAIEENIQKYYIGQSGRQHTKPLLESLGFKEVEVLSYHNIDPSFMYARVNHEY